MHYYLILIIFLQFMQLNGQQDSQLYNISQYCDTESKLIDLVSPSDGDYKIVILFQPNSCPRCESTFKVLNDYFVQNDIEYEYILTGVGSSENTIHQYSYLDSRVKFVDIDSIRTVLSLVEGNVQVPYVLKINKKGELLYHKSMLGILVNQDLMSEISVSETLDCVEFDPFSHINKTDYQISLRSHNQILDSFSDGNILSMLHISKEDYAMIESVSAQVIWMNINSDSICYSIGGSVEETNYFNANIPKEVMVKLDDYSILKTIYLKLFEVDSFGFKVIASLPKVVIEEEGYGYYNEPVMVYKTWGGKIIGIQNISIELGEFEVLKHAKSFTNGKNINCYKIVKGWPSVGTTSLPDSIAGKNLNSSKFYSHAYEYKCECNNGSEFNLGHLSEMHERYNLGYYVDYSGLHFKGDTIIFWNGINGRLDFLFFNKKNNSIQLLNSINLFEVDFDKFSNLSNTKIFDINDLNERELLLNEKIKVIDLDFENDLLISIIDKHGGSIVNLSEMHSGKLINDLNIDCLNIEYVFEFKLNEKENGKILQLIFESNRKIYKTEFDLSL